MKQMKIKTIEDILLPGEILKYREGWINFVDKYKLNSEYYTHSGKPMISQIFRFEDRSIFRAHVFNKKLRQFDPYFISEKHLNPYWRINHYQIVLEQLYHSSMRQYREMDEYHVREIPQEFKLSNPILWRDNVSIELIVQSKRKTEKYFIEDCYFTIYNDKSNMIKSRISTRTFTEFRTFVKDIKKIKQGQEVVIENLVRKIERQNINLKKLIKPRKKLLVTKDYLISELRKGNVLEKELHAFFSLWDK